MIVPTSIDITSVESDKRAWGNFIFSLSKSNTITVNNKKFEPNNSEKLSEIAKFCLAYDNTNNVHIPKNIIQPPLNVNVHYEQTKYSNIPINVPIVHLIGLTEKPFNVQKIIVNKGNCKVTTYGVDKLKQAIVYGEDRTIPLIASSTCNTILEIVVQTNLGIFAYTLE